MSAATAEATTTFVRPTFDEVYETHVDTLYRAARGMGVPPSSCEDVVQDVFLVVHRKLASFEGRSSVKTWLYRILLRVVSDHRRTKRRKGGLAELPEELPDLGGATPHDEVARAQAVKILEEILTSMPDEQRDVFVLAELEQVTVPEIAEALEVNINTIYSRLRLARREYERQLQRVRAKDDWRLP